MTSRQEKRHELRQQAITEVATRIFSEQGIHATSLTQIGKEVGLSKASLYYYVKSKEEIIALVLESVLNDINAYAETLIDTDSSHLEQLKMQVWAHVSSGESASAHFIVMNLDYLSTHKETARMMRLHEEPARKLLQQAIDAGEIRPIPITPAVKMLYTSLNAISRWYKPEFGTKREVFEQTWDIFINGVAAG
ncbi:MAG: TetR/AcrR family transcriptional regulator [Chloroflexota bacterium]